MKMTPAIFIGNKSKMRKDSLGCSVFHLLTINIPGNLKSKWKPWVETAGLEKSPDKIFLLGKLVRVQVSHPRTKSLTKTSKQWPLASKTRKLFVWRTSWNSRFEPWTGENVSLFKSEKCTFFREGKRGKWLFLLSYLTALWYVLQLLFSCYQ